MKSILLFLAAIIVSTLSFGQVSTYPYLQSFEDPFTYGNKVFFLPNWWGNYVKVDTMGQYDAFAHTGNYCLYMKPEGEEFKTMAQVKLDLTGKTNNYAEFWVASRKNGAPEDMKRVKLNVAVSIDGGITFPYVSRFGPHEGFPNADIPFEKFLFPLPPAVNDQNKVVFRFIGKSGGGPHLPGTLLIDDFMFAQADIDSFPPFIMGAEIPIPRVDSIRIPFSEPLQPDSALLLTHYDFTWPIEENGTVSIGEGPLPEIAAIELSEDGYTVFLTLDPPMSVGETYTLQMFNITDLNGNVADTLTMDGIVYNVLPPGSLVISEVLFDDPGTAYPMEKLQFVEIYNPTTEVVPLGGLRIKGAISAHDLPNVKLGPGEYWVATRNSVSFYATFGFDAWEWRGSWIEDEAEEGEEIEPQSLYIQTTNRHSGDLVDSIGFDLSDSIWLVLKQPGYSIEVCNNLTDNVDPANWTLADDSQAPYSYYYDGYTFDIYATPGRGCSGSENPVVNLGPDGNYCGITVLLLDAGNEGSHYLWSTGETTQTISVNTSGTYSVVVNNGNGAAYDTITVSLVPAITALASYSDTVCAKEEMEFNDTTTGAVAWMWNFGDGSYSTGKNALHTYDEAGNYDVRLMVYNAFGCTDTLVSSVQVYNNNVDWILPETICEGLESQFEDQSLSGIQWLWDFGDGNTSTARNPTHTYQAKGNYTVSLTVDNSLGCQNTVTTELLVLGREISWILPENLCEGVEAIFQDETPYAYSWLWDFGDGATSSEQNPSHAYGQSGVYTVSLTVSTEEGCSNIVSDDVEVKANTISWILPENLCAGIEGAFADNSIEAIIWTWNFGDGQTSQEQNPYHMYTEPGEYNLVLTVTNVYGCTATREEIVTVNPNEVVWTIPEGICEGTAALFADNTTFAASWLWDFGDGSEATDRDVTHTYAAAGEYEVSLTVTNSYGCTASLNTVVEVYSSQIDWLLPDMLCVGTEAEFEDQSEDAISWTWNFGDGESSSEQNPAHSYAESGTYTVVLMMTSASGCTSMISDEIEVTPVLIDWTLPVDICAGTEVIFRDASPDVAERLWDFGDSTSSEEKDPTHAYKEGGAYTVSLTITNSAGCTNTVSEELEVNDNELSWHLPDSPTCTDIALQFGSAGTSIINWLWDFGDESTSQLQNPVHAYSDPGVYMIKLTATNLFGCEYTLQEVIEVGVCVGIEEDNWDGQVSIYPNPGKGFVTLKSGIADNKAIPVRVFNSKGELVFDQTVAPVEGNTYQVDISRLPGGIYIINIMYGETILSRKLLIQK